MTMYQKYGKRLLDLVCSLLTLVLFCWLFLILAILIKIKLGSPVIFQQKRPGKNEKIFTLYKFRSMTNARDPSGNLLPDEKRLTPFGKFLRSTSLDELPEVFNILKGDMSVVGPRPLLVEYLPYYTQEERRRHDVRPGLTGLSQVSGRNLLGWNERFALDVAYVNHITFFLDIKIVIQTIQKTVRRSDIAMGTEQVLLDLNVERGSTCENCSALSNRN